MVGISFAVRARVESKRKARSFMVGRLFVRRLGFDPGSEAEEDPGSNFGKVGGIDLPLQGAIFVAVESGEAEEFVAEGGEADDAAAFVGEVGPGALVFTLEMGTGEEEGFEAGFGLGGFFSTSSDEVSEGVFDLFAVFGDKNGYADGAAFRRKFKPALLIAIADDFADGRVARFGSQEKEGGVDVAGLGLDGEDGFVLLGVLEASHELERTFRKGDGGLDIDRSFGQVDGDAGEFQSGEGIVLFFLFLFLFLIASFFIGWKRAEEN
jgi:hypothetical protein